MSGAGGRVAIVEFEVDGKVCVGEYAAEGPFSGLLVAVGPGRWLSVVSLDGHPLEMMMQHAADLLLEDALGPRLEEVHPEAAARLGRAAGAAWPRHEFRAHAYDQPRRAAARQ